MRWLLCFAVVFMGCVASIPSDHGLSADLACEASRAVVQMRQGMPPTPKPVDDRCENCDGTGTLGDGRITRQCPVCKGTGKKVRSVLINPAVCTSGSCRP